MIPHGVIVLSSLWIFAHLLILPVVYGGKYRRVALVCSGLLLLLVYSLKPYTYDLDKYSIYFVTGYIPTIDWHTPDDGFQLDARDTTGDPYDGYELGFNLLSKVAQFVLPAGSLLPRYDANYWDFVERPPPRYDAIFLLIMIFCATSLIYSTKKILQKTVLVRAIEPSSLALILLVVLGSVFFFIGTQNVVRQFLGLVFVLSAINSGISRRFLVSLFFIVLACLFHRWALVFAIILVTAMIGLFWIQKLWPEEQVRVFRITRVELLSLFAGVVVLVTIKGLVVLGAFHIDLPLIGDLKAYVVNQDQYQMFERLAPSIKLVSIIGLFGISEVVLGVTTISRPVDCRLMRRAIILFVLPLCLYPELFARVLIGYWMIEMIFVAWALLSTRRRTQLAGTIVFVAYGLAPNALNILLGPDWLRSI